MSPLGRRRRAAGSGRVVHVRTPPRLLEALRDGPLPLAPGADPEAASLEVAVVVPQFRRGSGGHHTIADLVRGLEARGHRLSLWLADEEALHEGATAAEAQEAFRRFFGPMQAPLHLDPAAFTGADVVLATGWQTVPLALRLPGARARAYLVQDHEPEFFGTSAERTWAAWTYGQGLHCICASPWLTGLVRETYGATATTFDLGVDHEHYRPLPTHRRDDLVLAYARAATGRRAVPLVALALEELHRRRPHVDIALFGEGRELGLPFPAQQLGVLAPDDLAHAYASATVGVVLSLTNPSLVPTEMLACGLPVVDVRSAPMLATFGADAPLELAEPDPLALCAAVERLLDDLVLRAERAREGVALAAARTWDRAAAQVEDGLRAALHGAPA